MPPTEIDQSVVVSTNSIGSDDPYDVVSSSISFLDALLDEHFKPEELSRDALKSYQVDNFLGEVENGGFSQFVYNSGWDPDTVRLVREGLRDMGAVKHLALFEESAAIVDRIGVEGMEKFFESDYFGENAERDILNLFDDRFFELSEEEDLMELNAKWLRGLPSLVVKTVDEMEAEIARRAEALPDREERAAEALANEPRYMKLIRALCEAAGHELFHVTAGDPTHEYDGEPVLAWHFITDRGHHYIVDAGGQAVMFDGDSDTEIATIKATDAYGTDE